MRPVDAKSQLLSVPRSVSVVRGEEEGAAYAQDPSNLVQNGESIVGVHRIDAVEAENDELKRLIGKLRKVACVSVKNPQARMLLLARLYQLKRVVHADVVGADLEEEGYRSARAYT